MEDLDAIKLFCPYNTQLFVSNSQFYFRGT